jgi:hypothetical protein
MTATDPDAARTRREAALTEQVLARVLDREGERP